MQGKVKWFNAEKGFGFIDRGEGKDVFVHITQMQKAGINPIVEGAHMAYELYNDKGRIAAGNLSVIDDNSKM